MGSNGIIDPAVLFVTRSYGTIYLYALVGYIFSMRFYGIVDPEMFFDMGSKWLLDPMLTHVT